MAYAEALFLEGAKCARRDPVPGGAIGENGYADRIEFAGGKAKFQPFWYRSGRYVELEFELSQAVEMELRFEFLAYPLKRRVEFYGGSGAREDFRDRVAHRPLLCA